MERLKQGTKIRRTTWTSCSSWRLVDGKLQDNNGKIIDDWEIVEDKLILPLDVVLWDRLRNRIYNLEKEVKNLRVSIDDIRR